MTALSELDNVAVPDRWAQITERAAQSETELGVFEVSARRHQWLVPAAVAATAALVMVGAVASRSDRGETVTAGTTPPLAEAPPEATPTASPEGSLPLSSGPFAVPILVDGGIGREGLLQWVWTELLAWPGDPSWEDVDGLPRASHPETDRSPTVSLVPDGEGWAIVGIFGVSGIRPLLDDDANLAGFARLGTPSSEVESVEVLEIASPADSRSLSLTGWDDEVIELATPIEARAARSYVVITRDQAGEAVDINGWAFGRPDRLDLDLDELLSEPGVADPISVPLGVDLGGRLEPPRRLAAVWPGVDAYISPLEDRSALCLSLVEPDGSGARTCAYASDFNQHGIKFGTHAEDEDPWIVLVVPESAQLGDLGDATVHPSGLVIAWTAPGTAVQVGDRFELFDGVLQPSRDEPAERAITPPTETTSDGTLAAPVPSPGESDSDLEELSITAVDGAAPTQLASTAVVLEVEEVGVVEVGEPPASLLADAPELQGAECTATESGYTCPFTRPDGTGGSRSGSSESGPFFSSSRIPPHGAYFLIEVGRAVVIGGIGDDVAVVEIDVADVIYHLRPVAGVVAAPLDPSVDAITVRARDQNGTQLWSEPITFPDPADQAVSAG
ncbi:MAG: hypothetical protein AAGD18_18405 [Actinomycetota bacterium]